MEVLSVDNKIMTVNGKLAKAPSTTGTGDMKKSVYDPTGTVEAAGGIPDYVANNAPVTSVNGKTGAVTLVKADVGLSQVDNVTQYSAKNPPPYPVTSVNGQTGAVILSASDIGAQSTITVNGILKGDGVGGVSAAIPGTDYADVFIITVGTTTDNGDGTYSFTPDKTYEEVNTAILNGKQCYVKYSGIYYPLANTIEIISDDGVSYVAAAIFTVAFEGLAMRSINMTNGLHGDTATWVINATETAASFPSNPSNGQVLYYKTGIDRGWYATNIRSSLATDFTGIIKGANGKLAQAEAGTDYMAPVVVTTADNGKFLRVVNGAWAAVEIANANGGSF